MAKNKTEKSKGSGNAVRKKAEPTPIYNQPYVLLAAAVLITLVCYIPAFTNGWTNWDDQGYVYENDMTKNLSFATLYQFFSTYQMGNYHPLPMVSLGFDYMLFGKDAAGFHFHSILLHLVNVALVFLFVWLLIRKAWAAAITALLFGIHPAHVESVAWISERKDLLYVLYYMAALIAYVRYLQLQKSAATLNGSIDVTMTGEAPPVNKRGKSAAIFYLLAIGFFTLSLLSKGQAVTLAVVLVLIDFFLRRPLNKKMLLEKIPFFALSLAFGLVAVSAQQEAKAIQDIPYFQDSDRLIFSLSSLGTYFYKALVPLKLSAFYPYPRIINNEYPLLDLVLLPVVSLVLAVVICFFVKGRTLLFGFGFFLFNIALLLQLLPVGGAMMADRYTYLAYVGLFFVMGMGVQWIADNSSASASMIKGVGFLLVAVFTAYLGTKTYTRNHVWQSSETLYLDMLDNYNYIPVAHNNLGNFYQKNEQIDKALAHFNEAISLQANYKEARINRSDVFRQKGKIDSAIMDCSIVIRLDPGYEGAFMNRGIAYSIAGKYDSAMHDFNTVIMREPNNSKAHGNRGNLFDMKGKYDSAIADYNAALSLDPEYLDVYGNRGRSYLKKGMYDEAIKDLSVALQLQPNNAEYYALRADANNNRGNYQQALSDALAAEKFGKPINPAFIEMLKNKIK